MSRGADGDGDTPPTRSYVDALLRGNLSPDQVAALRMEIASQAEEEAKTIARSYPPRAPASAPPVSSGRTRGGSHPPSAPPPASWPSPWSYAPPGGEEGHDDQRTVVRSYRPAAEEEEAPFSFEPPADIGEPYVFDDEAEADDLTAVHVYSSREIGEMIHLGDLGDLGGVPGHERGDPAGTPPPVEPPASSPEYQALLAQTYLAALGGMESVPRVAVGAAEVCSLPLGPQAAFVLSRLDGQSSVEDVLDMAGLARVETLRILYDLLQQGVIGVEA